MAIFMEQEKMTGQDLSGAKKKKEIQANDCLGYLPQGFISQHIMAIIK